MTYVFVEKEEDYFLDNPLIWSCLPPDKIFIKVKLSLGSSVTATIVYYILCAFNAASVLGKIFSCR